MTENPYQAPADDAQPAKRWTTKLRWYHVPFIIAVACGIALVTLYKIVPRDGKFQTWRSLYLARAFAVIEAIFVVDLAACASVIWKRWRTGRNSDS